LELERRKELKTLKLEFERLKELKTLKGECERLKGLKRECESRSWFWKGYPHLEQ
jgi:hypothetical protein